MGDGGNNYFRELELPAIRRMAGAVCGAQALGLATGNRLVARWLATEGACVTATDGASSMVHLAEARSAAAECISFCQLDVTSPESLPLFIKDRAPPDGFDIVTMNMAMMDIHDLQPLALALPELLKKHTGRFVATLLHPVFGTSGATRERKVQINEDNGHRDLSHSISLSRYLDIPPENGFFRRGQPEPHMFFHRPIHELLRLFFEAGLVLDALEEPNFGKTSYDASRVCAARNFVQIPKILAFRLRTAS
ncbi:hypothetical protein BDV12DRAFT_97270 [Aspergillus spectabilis]